MKKSSLDYKTLLAKADAAVRRAQRFSLPAFLCLVALLYGFVLLRINTLRNTEPSPAAVTGQVKAAGVPHIDETTLSQLESLHNNSVNVQALFNDARNNPFQ